MIVARLLAVERLAAGVELGVVDVVAVAAEAVDVALVDDPDVLQAGEPRAALARPRRGARRSRRCTPTAPESARIHSTWSAEDVS